MARAVDLCFTTHTQKKKKKTIPLIFVVTSTITNKTTSQEFETNKKHNVFIAISYNRNNIEPLVMPAECNVARRANASRREVSACLNNPISSAILLLLLLLLLPPLPVRERGERRSLGDVSTGECDKKKRQQKKKQSQSIVCTHLDLMIMISIHCYSFQVVISTIWQEFVIHCL
jgi:hypothetical protein